MIAVALYLRLSKEDKTGKLSGIDSIATQKGDGIQAISEQPGWNLDPRHIYIDDDTSGRLVSRSDWDRMEEAAARGEFTILALRDMDRFARYEPARQMKTLIELFDIGVRLWEYPSKSFVRLSGPESIITYAKAIASEQYVESIRKNITAGLKRRAADGMATTRAAFGYKIETHPTTGPRWVIVEAQADLVRMIADLFIATESLAATARILNERGIPTPWAGKKGGERSKWGHAKVSKILRRPNYRGWTTHGGVRVEHPEMRIFSPEVEQSVDVLLARPQRSWGRQPAHLCTPFIRCGVCMGCMVVTSSKRSKTHSVVCDRQRVRGCEGVGYRPEPKVERGILMAASEVVEPEQWARTKEILREALQIQKRTCKRESEIERLSREIQLTEKKARAAEEMAYDAEGSERERHRASLRSHLAQLDLLKRALAEVARQPALEDPDDILAAAEAHVVHLREQLARGGLEAAPAVRAVMGQEKFLATRQADGTWALTADVSTAFLFEGLGTNQKAKITGTSVPVTTSPAAGGATTTTGVTGIVGSTGSSGTATGH